MAGGTRKVIGVDFDDTLVRSDGNGNYAPVRGAAEAMAALKAKGYWLVIYTCRTGIADAQGNLQEEIEHIESLLRDFGIPFDEIHTGEKLVAHAYIDDRAVRFEGDWAGTLSVLTNILQKKR